MAQSTQRRERAGERAREGGGGGRGEEVGREKAGGVARLTCFPQDVVEKYVKATLQNGSPLAMLHSCFNERTDRMFAPGPERNSAFTYDSWMENVAILIANNVKGSNKALLQLGDQLHKEHGGVESSHFCYLLGGLEPELHETEKTNMLLIGANHKNPQHRIEYLSVQSIQFTLVYEYARQLGNPQFTMPLLIAYRCPLHPLCVHQMPVQGLE